MKTTLSFLISLIVVLFHFGAGEPSASEGPRPELFLQLGHTGSVQSVAFSPDGSQLASGSDDSTIKMWEGMNGSIMMSMLLLPGNQQFPAG